MATDGNICQEKGDDDPDAPIRKCIKYVASNAPGRCEALCDTFTWCTAYSHAIARGECHLYTRQENPCPNGYQYWDGAVLMSIDEFEGVRRPEYSGCYVKGKTK